MGFESDGLRVFTIESLNFLCFVPECMQHVLGVTSSSPSALLFDASKKLEQNCLSCDVYGYVSMIGENINNAVDECIETAAQDFNTKTQKELLKVFLNFIKQICKIKI